MADIGKPYLDCIITVAKSYVTDIFATLHRYEYSPELMRLYIVVCETAKGYEYLAHASLRRKE